MTEDTSFHERSSETPQQKDRWEVPWKVLRGSPFHRKKLPTLTFSTDKNTACINAKHVVLLSDMAQTDETDPNKPLINGFNHKHRIFMCCFRCIHVKTATIVIACVSLFGLCFSLFWRIKTSQENSTRSTSLKLSAIPIIIAISTIFYLFIGIIKKDAKYLLPFIFVQITGVFMVAIMLIIMVICVLCDTRYLVDAFIGEEIDHPDDYNFAKTLLISMLIVQLILQIWTTRIVCVCYRYFNEFHNYRERHSQV